MACGIGLTIHVVAIPVIVLLGMPPKIFRRRWHCLGVPSQCAPAGDHIELAILTFRGPHLGKNGAPENRKFDVPL
jgi:hypothetical protein